MSGITRRNFIKYGVGGIAILAAGLSPEGKTDSLVRGKSVSRTTGRVRKSIPSVCMMCPASCGILGYLEYEKVVKIGGNPLDPNSRGRLCAKGIAGLNHLYNPDRILFPMRRVGKRGEGRWKQISWDEAFNEIALRLKAIQTEKQHHDFIIRNTWDLSGNELAGRFASAFGSSTTFQHAILDSPNGTFAIQNISGYPMGIGDVAHARYILNFGANPYESHFLYVPFIQRLIDARVNLGAKLVTFDVRISQTAGKSDEWFPIIPGTDGMVVLAMAHVIANEGLWDKEFIEQWTNTPPSRLLRHLSSYPPKKAESLCGVRASDIRRIAIEFATTKPSLAIGGGGLLKHINGTSNQKSILLLNALVGNLDAKGGYYFPQTYPLDPPDPKPPKSKSVNSESPTLFLRVNRGVQRIGVLMTHMDNPVYKGPDSKLISHVLQDESKIPFHVSIDPFLNESNLYADLLLPEATYLERWDLLSPPPMERVPFIALRQPVSKPLGQSLPFSDILIELSQRIGGGMERYFKFGRMEHYIEAMTRKIPKLVDAGGIDFLMEKGIWFDPIEKPTYRSYEQKKLKTPSGKFEIDPFPIYSPIPHHQRLGDGEFHLITFQWNVHTYSLTANCKWLTEIVHTNPLWINEEIAKRVGLKNGDRVKITSQVGSLITPVFTTQGIHPKVMALSDSLGRWHYGRIARGKPFQSEDPETSLIWWGKHGTGVHPNPIIPILPDPSGGGQGWMDTVVRVEKV
ncbi:MAG: molybdopterin-dependent oxidoreductase [Thermodesulfobacteriota bacterium]|nr:molybdopterin-dependent oxidoreductase [Thermodesulfobacteriota bacterium]